MSQRRLSQHSIALSDISTRHSSMTYHSNTSLSQSQGLLTRPPEYGPIHDASANEDEDTPDLHDTPTKRQGRWLWRRIGRWGLVVMPLGSLLLLVSIAFLQFLWLQARKAKDGKEPHKLWQTIVFRDWITRAATITAVLMRSVITAQVAVVTSMVASIIVESSVYITQLPILSIARAINVSPTTLVTLIYTNTRLTSEYLSSLLVITTCLLALGGQFISTLLLSDFRETSIASPPISSMHRMGSIPDIVQVGPQPFWTQAPQAFWRFAEYHVPNLKTTPNSVDTGVTFRAVIPWPDEKSRLGLSFYTGKTPTWDARVVCFSPSLENASFTADSRSKNIQGSLAYNLTKSPFTYSPSSQSEDDYTASVNCTMDLFASISVCMADNVFTLDSSLAQSLGMNQDVVPPKFITSDNYLVFIFMRDTYDGLGFSITFTGGQSDAEWSIQRDGPWTKGFHSSDQVFALSYCSTTSTIYNLEVAMHGTSGVSEPPFFELLPPGEVQGDDSIVIDRAQVRPLRRQLGTTLVNSTLQDRGLLSLDIPRQKQNPTRYKGVLSQLQDSVSPTLYFAGVLAGMGGTAGVHELHRALFEDIVHDTGNPALALQAFSTTLNQMKYYESSYRWTDSNSITYITAKYMSIPVGRAGFLSVIAIVAAHLGILVVTSVLFVQRTKATLIGDPWQSIAQVVSDDTLPILTRVDGLEDKKDKEMPNVTGVIQQRPNGRTEFGEKQD
ncbi:hypothetical protein PG984_000145 [Apiospora sp. TS-2023a]